MQIQQLNDLNQFRSAPTLNLSQTKFLLAEISIEIKNADWITIGVMAPTDFKAIKALNSLIKKYKNIDYNNLSELKATGHVFLKGNQKTGEVYIRNENGLGEGILLTCQYDNKLLDSKTYGPFPLEFFEFN